MAGRFQFAGAALLGACLALGVAGAPHPVRAVTVERLADEASWRTDGRTVTVTTTTGQRLQLTSYGDSVLRVRALRAGEAGFPDSRYEMVEPSSFTTMTGHLDVTEASDRLTVSASGTDGIRVVLLKHPLRALFSDKRTGSPYAQEDTTHSVVWSASDVVRQEFVPGTGERFLKGGHGTFGRSPRLDRTGDTVSQNYPTSAYDQAPAIVPFYLSSRGYAVFVNTGFDTSYHFGGAGAYDFTINGDAAGGPSPQLDWFLLRGPSFPTLLNRYTQLTGRPALPPEWAFGLQLSDKNYPSVSTAAWWQQKITQLRNAGYPLDHQVNDNRWREGTGAWSGSWFQFSRTRWPDPAAYERWAADNGVTVTLDYNRNNSNEMAGWVGGPPPGYSFPAASLTAVPDPDSAPDWSGRGARAWLWNVFWTKAVDPALRYPRDGLWLDETDQMGPIPYSTVAANGQRWSELRNSWFLQLLKGVAAEGWLPNAAGHVGDARRPWIWTRGASAGMQRYGSMWTGDIDSTYAEMQLQIRGVQAEGLGGLPFANVDGGGYQGTTVPDALYRNWAAAWSSLSPIWRPHGEGNTATLGAAASRWPTDRSAAVQADFRRYAILRYTTMPYIYSLAHQANATGMPMARAMVLGYQDRSPAYSHDLQYQWGPSEIVAPETADGGVTQHIWLPAGSTWYDYWTDRTYPGSDSADLTWTAATGQIPLFVRAGALIPTYPYAQTTAWMDKRTLGVEAYAGRDGSFDLYEDDGVSQGYRHGASATTTLQWTDAARRLVVRQPVGTYPGAPTQRRYVVRIHGLSAPVAMRVDGGATLPATTSAATALIRGSGTAWDSSSKVLTVVTPLLPVVQGGGVAATVEPSGQAYPAVDSATAYEAENASRNAVNISTRYAGYTGTGYGDYADSAATGGWLQWSVRVGTAGNHILSLRYANGGATSRPLAVAVNGVTKATATCPPTGSWGTWGTASVTATLPAGTSTVRATTTGANGGNVDVLVVR